MLQIQAPAYYLQVTLLPIAPYDISIILKSKSYEFQYLEITCSG